MVSWKRGPVFGERSETFFCTFWSTEDTCARQCYYLYLSNTAGDKGSLTHEEEEQVFEEKTL